MEFHPSARHNFNQMVYMLYQKPACCPHCGNGINADIVQATNAGNKYRMVVFKCNLPSCAKVFACLYAENDPKTHDTDFLYMYPHAPMSSVAQVLFDTSARFKTLYRQAERAERAGDTDLAACGYRNAIEALIKDFAHVFKDIPLDEKLKGKSIHSCIADYLQGMDETITAYFVKEHGNSATHYPPVGEPFDFAEQKDFLEAFLSAMTSRIKIQLRARDLSDRVRRKFGLPHPKDAVPSADDQ